MNSAFSSQILAEKLSKLNNSQQSIETLSHWCIFHRKKAKQVVETWEKLFNNSPKEQKVPYLYLANDILQNSRRKGSEFVNEFWKVLPGALRSVYEYGDDNGKNVIMRLVDIWDERKVFGSRGRGLKDDILGKAPPQVLENNGKSSNPIKIVKKDAYSIRIKLAVGGMPERIVTAYQSVLDEHFNEDAALNKCKTAVSRVGNIEKDVDEACNRGDVQGLPFEDELQEQEVILKQCVEQLENVEASRSTLLVQLKEAFQEQEMKLEAVRNQLQVARAETDRASNLRQRIMSASGPSPSINQAITTSSAETAPVNVCNPPLQSPSTQSQPVQPVTSFAMSMSTLEDEHKKAAAAVAAKLAASTSSAQMLTSVLSSLVAEEAASKNGGLSSGSFTIFPVEKRAKLEKPVPLSDMGSSYFGQVQQQPLASLPLTLPQASSTSMQPPAQPNQPPPPFTPPPPPLPPPPSVQQYVQTSGVIVGVLPYGFGSGVLPPPPPPLPSHASMNLARPNAPQPPPLPPPRLQQQQQQLPSQAQLQPQPQPHSQQSASTGFYPSPGIGFYGQPPAAPSVARQ